MDISEFPRIGFLYDGTAETPRVPASLSISRERGIRVDVPIAQDEPGGHSDWFFADDVSPPSYLVFQDYRAAMHLIDCKPAGFRGSPRSGVGVLSAAFAVQDSDANSGDYNAVHKLRSEIDGLYDFVGLKSKDVKAEYDDDGLISGASIRMVRHDSVEIGDIGGVKVTIEPHWSVDNDGDQSSAVHENTWLQTESPVPLPLRDHLILHRSFRDFLALAYWQPLDFLTHEVQHHDLPARVLTGAPIGPAWRDTFTISTLRSRARSEHGLSASQAVQALAHFDQLGAGALLKWFEVHDKWARVIDPLVGLRFAADASIDVGLLQSGIAMEAYGYIAALDGGVSPRTASSMTYKSRLLSAMDQFPADVSRLVKEDLESWAQKAANTYNAVKHANRALPDRDEAVLTLLTILFILRVLILKLIGMPDGELAKLPQHFVWQRLGSEHDFRVAAGS